MKPYFLLLLIPLILLSGCTSSDQCVEWENTQEVCSNSTDTCKNKTITKCSKFESDLDSEQWRETQIDFMVRANEDPWSLIFELFGIPLFLILFYLRILKSDKKKTKQRRVKA